MQLYDLCMTYQARLSLSRAASLSRPAGNMRLASWITLVRAQSNACSNTHPTTRTELNSSSSLPEFLWPIPLLERVAISGAAKPGNKFIDVLACCPASLYKKSKLAV